MLMFEKIIVLFLLMVVGFIIMKAGMIDEKDCKGLSAIVINVANPAMILNASTSGEGSIAGKDLIVTALLAVGLYAILVMTASILPKVMRLKKEEAGCYKLMLVFSNIGYMGFPLIASLYGSEAVLYGAIFLMPFSVLIYTYGIKTIRLEKEKEGKGNRGKLLNIGIISCLLTIIIYLSGIKLPSVINDTIGYLSSLTSPLSMIVIGASLATMNLKELVSDKKLILFSAIKLLVIPIIGCMLLKLVVTNELIRNVCMVILATPVASMVTMLAQQYDGDYELASKGIALTTLLSMITLPIIFTLFS